MRLEKLQWAPSPAVFGTSHLYFRRNNDSYLPQWTGHCTATSLISGRFCAREGATGVFQTTLSASHPPHIAHLPRLLFVKTSSCPRSRAARRGSLFIDAGRDHRMQLSRHRTHIWTSTHNCFFPSLGGPECHVGTEQRGDRRDLISQHRDQRSETCHQIGPALPQPGVRTVRRYSVHCHLDSSSPQFTCECPVRRGQRAIPHTASLLVGGRPWMAEASWAPCGAAHSGLALKPHPLPTDPAPLHVDPIDPPAPPLLVQLQTQGEANPTRKGSGIEQSRRYREPVLCSVAQRARRLT